MDKFSQGQILSGGRDQPPDRGTEHSPVGADAPAAHPEAAILSLKHAMRRARFDDAERSDVITDLRAARIARLEVLQEALGPLIAQIPAGVELFDIGITRGTNPRLFIDMIAFVELGRDSRVYRFLQDTRNGRVILAESESVDAIVEAATYYVARRLLEREKALAADVTGVALDSGGSAAGPRPPEKPKAAPRLTFLGLLGLVFVFIINVLGSMTFFGLLAFAAWIAWSNYHP
ncbi:MAG: hypothetical protein P4L76_02315 [Beijerinckiaceae bacterium]|nr:hypothetical protein [Beijerinckiaceae bacterium]